MSARNMVRNLRDSGALDTRPPPPRTRRTFALVVAAVAFGFMAYFAATAGGPALLKAMEKKPAPVSFAKP
jgi:hypothetical protein